MKTLERPSDNGQSPSRPYRDHHLRLQEAVVETALARDRRGRPRYRHHHHRRRHLPRPHDGHGRVRHGPGRATGSRADCLRDRNRESAKHDQRRHPGFGYRQRNRRRLQLQGPQGPGSRAARSDDASSAVEFRQGRARAIASTGRRGAKHCGERRDRHQHGQRRRHGRRGDRACRASERAFQPASDRQRRLRRDESAERAASRAADGNPRRRLARAGLRRAGRGRQR